MPQHNTMVPAGSASDYDSARRHAALIDRSNLGRIVISGADRRSYLQGLLTNDIESLGAGQGCYAAYLTAQGRMIADMHVYELGDAILMTTAGDVKDVLLARFDQFVFSEDVQLGDVTASFAQVAVIGPDAARHVLSRIEGVSETTLLGMPEHGNVRAVCLGGAAVVTRTSDAGEPGFDVYMDRALSGAFIAGMVGAGVPCLDEGLAEAIRIERGVPRFHRDMDEGTIPLEAGIESRAISFDKGCYVGQEVIIRVLHRGHGRVARKLVGLRFDGEQAPPVGAKVSALDREIGHVTSSTWSPALGGPIALAYVHRDFVASGTAVEVENLRAEVTTLPFVPLA